MTFCFRKSLWFKVTTVAVSFTSILDCDSEINQLWQAVEHLANRWPPRPPHLWLAYVWPVRSHYLHWLPPPSTTTGSVHSWSIQSIKCCWSKKTFHWRNRLWYARHRRFEVPAQARWIHWPRRVPVQLASYSQASHVSIFVFILFLFLDFIMDSITATEENGLVGEQAVVKTNNVVTRSSPTKKVMQKSSSGRLSN